MSKKTIKINPRTHNRLKNIGEMGDTFDDVINELIDNYIEAEKC